VFDRVTIRVSDRDAAERFYGGVLDAAGLAPPTSGSEATEWDDFSLATAGAGRPTTRRLHLGFAVSSRSQVDAFWEAGRSAGHPDAGAPGPRPEYTEDYYGAFLLDPDGNSAEAVHHAGVRSDGNVDHVWIRVADLAAAKRFYDTLAPHAGLRPEVDSAERASFVRAGPGGGTFSLLPGPPTEHLHMAFPARGDATVQAFDGGLLLDPDGNTIEVVDHHR
jgi:catechol 2,3-dioxygenase-like lactoylglutathione lyase family enzyme